MEVVKFYGLIVLKLIVRINVLIVMMLDLVVELVKLKVVVQFVVNMQ